MSDKDQLLKQQREEIEKLKKDETYLPLYKIAKEHSNRMMKRKRFEPFESYLAEEIISSYNEKEVIVDTISKRESKYNITFI